MFRFASSTKIDERAPVKCKVCIEAIAKGRLTVNSIVASDGRPAFKLSRQVSYRTYRGGPIAEKIGNLIDVGIPSENHRAISGVVGEIGR